MDEPNVGYVKTADLRELPELTPKRDPTFNVLLELALAGELDVYFAVVPLSLIRPYDLDYDALAHPIGRAAVDQAFNDAMSGKHHAVWVYEEHDGFVLSDDYVTLAAARRGQPDYMSCFIFGRPRHSAVKDVQGPVDVRDALGWK